MQNKLLKAIENDKRIPISFPPNEISSGLNDLISKKSGDKKLILVIGSPGIGKSHVCNNIKNEFEDHIEKFDVKNYIYDEDALSIKIEGVKGNRLLLDNFDRLFKYSFSEPKGDWTSLDEEMREGPAKTVVAIKAFFESFGAQLIIFVQDQTYYEIQSDIEMLLHGINRRDERQLIQISELEANLKKILPLEVPKNSSDFKKKYKSNYEYREFINETFPEIKLYVEELLNEDKDIGSLRLPEDINGLYKDFKRKYNNDPKYREFIHKTFPKLQPINMETLLGLEGKITKTIFSLGLPSNYDEFKEMYDNSPQYREFVASLMASFVAEGVDYYPLQFLVTLVIYWKKASSQNLELTSKQIEKFLVHEQNVYDIKKLFSRLGLFYVHKSEKPEKNIIIVSQDVMKIAENALKNAGFLSTGWQRLKTYFILGFPGAFVFIVTGLFMVLLFPTLTLAGLPPWVFFAAIIIGTPCLAILFGWIFDAF